MGKIHYVGAENIAEYFGREKFDAVVSANFLASTPGVVSGGQKPLPETLEELAAILRKALEATKKGGIHVHVTYPAETVFGREDFEKAGFQVLREPKTVKNILEAGPGEYLDAKVFVLNKIASAPKAR